MSNMGVTLAMTKARARRPGSNVVVLPTAAPRQVRQPTGRVGWEQRGAFRRENAFPREYIDPRRREALKLAKIVREIEQTPALLIATAIYAVMTPENRVKVVEHLASGAAAGLTAHVQAVAALRAMTGTVGEQMDMQWALERLSETGTPV